MPSIKFHSPNIQLSSNNAKKAAINYYFYSRQCEKKAMKDSSMGIHFECNKANLQTDCKLVLHCARHKLRKREMKISRLYCEEI